MLVTLTTTALLSASPGADIAVGQQCHPLTPAGQQWQEHQLASMGQLLLLPCAAAQ